MAATNLVHCSKCQLPKQVTYFTKMHLRGLVMGHHSRLSSRLTSYNLPNKCCQFATIAEIESKQFLKRRLVYFNLLIKLEGLDGAVLDNLSQFVVSSSKMMNLQVTKKFNLATEKFSQTLAYPPDSYRKQSLTYHLKKHGRMIEIGEVPVEKADIFIQYLQDNVPVGVSVKMELKKWQDFVSPPDPRYLEQKQLEYERMRERKKKREE
ncbi:small ribosomal subunit protein uS10m-like isoform X3 [Montipora capricornis]|uniref:small ribosomal subunit protein uS10m-like isoform X3 n=1 Tax=Montipora capricornis TaxID=246305 RepID=UPI0035F18F07